VLVDRLDSHAVGADLERTVRVRWRDGETRLTARAPAELAGPPDDASFFLCTLLLPAMRLHEDLEIDAPVSERLLLRQERIQRTWHAWDRSIRPCEVRTAGVVGAGGPARGEVACFFTRGVDSTYSATVPRAEPGPIERLVFITGIEPVHDKAVADEEIRLAREAAAAIGMPLSVCGTNLRALTDGILSWGDVHGAALAGVATALAGGVRHMVIPATHNLAGVGPYGTHPLVDPLFSTERVAVEHDELVARVDKVRWLAHERPELLPHLKVCFTENRADNCGRCMKCLLTMAALEAAGALGRASSFPDEIDAGLIAAIRHDGYSQRLEWVELMRALPDGPVRDAVRVSLRRSTVPGPRDVVRALKARRVLWPAWSDSRDSFTRHRVNTAISLFVKGRPYP
jgi:hypothetical protein